MDHLSFILFLASHRSSLATSTFSQETPFNQTTKQLVCLLSSFSDDEIPKMLNCLPLPEIPPHPFLSKSWKGVLPIPNGPSFSKTQWRNPTNAICNESSYATDVILLLAGEQVLAYVCQPLYSCPRMYM